MFLKLMKSIMLSGRLHLETGIQKFKIAAAKTGSICISASIQGSKEVPEAYSMFPRSGNLMALSGRLHADTRSKKFKMVADHQRVHHACDLEEGTQHLIVECFIFA
jgi:hypothetical protein